MSRFFEDLTADARCNRFMHPVREPESELLRQFTQVDYANHVALVAEILVDGRVFRECRRAGCDPAPSPPPAFA
jgi:hypothetical protein